MRGRKIDKFVEARRKRFEETMKKTASDGKGFRKPGSRNRKKANA